MLNNIRFFLHLSTFCSLQRKATSEGTPQVSYECNYCGKRFATANGHRYHVMSHQGLSRYCCPICNRGFSCTRGLSLHISKHTGVKQYVCPICQKAFGYEPDLKSHLRVFHNEPNPMAYSVANADWTVDVCTYQYIDKMPLVIRRVFLFKCMWQMWSLYHCMHGSVYTHINGITFIYSEICIK